VRINEVRVEAEQAAEDFFSSLLVLRAAASIPTRRSNVLPVVTKSVAQLQPASVSRN
jgi:hypothetical protein